MSEDLKAPIPDKSINQPISIPKISRNNPLVGESAVPKTVDHNIQFKADAGSHHPTSEGLIQTNKAHFSKYKSSVLGREYPATPEGAKQMRKDEALYWENQKINTEKQG